jgi:hypothetical protein
VPDDAGQYLPSEGDEVRAADMAALLADRAEDVAALLLPNGKRKGREWCVGSLDGEDGESLKVHLGGLKSGVWQDFASGEGGDLIDLWAGVRRLTLAQAFVEVREYLGIREHRVENPKRTYSKPTREGVTGLPPQMSEWLTTVRKISPETIKRFKLAARKGALMFPYLRDGELVAAKYRKVPAKEFFVDADCEPCLFGWHALTGKERAIVLCEGECFPGDAQVMTRRGWVALSAYRGGEVAQYVDGRMQWVHPLARIEKQFSGELVRYETRGYVSVTTPDHNLISMDARGREYKHTAEAGPNSGAHLIPRAGVLDGAGIALSDAQIRLCIAISADAAIDVRKQSYGGGQSRVTAAESRYARFGFKKARKVARLRQILSDCGISASDNAISGGCQSICLPIPAWVPGRLLPWEWIADATAQQREMIIAELVHWDGNSVPGRNQSEYASKHIENAEWVQALAHSAGRVSSIIRRNNEHGNWFKVSILHGKKTTSWQSLRGKARRVPHDGPVFCVQVPSGALVVRQEEKITITGNCDALAFAEYGIPALSVPFGGGKGAKQGQWIEAEFDRLAIFDTLFLAMDDDGPGAEATAEIVKRMGRERCRIVKLPHKDANECLMQGVSKDEIRDALKASRTMDPEQLRRASEFVDALVAEFAIQIGDETGIRLPFAKAGNSVVLRPEELSIWLGVNGHGKSIGMGQVTIGAMVQGFRCCVASMEHRPVKWLKRMVRQATANEQPSQAYIRHVANWLHDRLWVFNAIGTAKAEQIVEVFAYAARRYRVRFFLIDNLAKCGFAEDDYNGQKKFVDVLGDFAKEYGVHVALVHHLRKGESEDKPGGKMDAKGTGAITDMAATCAVWWRNKPKEKAINAAKMKGADPDPQIASKPDALLIFDKQNNGECEPTFSLWFDQRSMQFLEHEHSRPYSFIGFERVEQSA